MRLIGSPGLGTLIAEAPLDEHEIPRAMSLDRPPAPRPEAILRPPAGLSRALSVPATRVLQHMPDALLQAMARGVTLNADGLVAGALFRDRDSSGCAVGITLRELAPDAFHFGRLEFWLWHRWRRGVAPDVARRFPQLRQLQPLFDQAVAELNQLGRHEQPAKTVGLWLAACAQAELQGRSASTAPTRRLAKQSIRRSRRGSHPSRRGHPALRPRRPNRHRAVRSPQRLLVSSKRMS